MPPAWGVYVTVDDVDETAKKTEALGGKILRRPEDIPDVGRFCVLSDPQGAVICAITFKEK
jgi:predicted enzyme related to lactoylglutathione lyase